MRLVRPAGVAPPRAATSHILLAYSIAGVLIGLDLLTKRWAAIEFTAGPRTIIPGVLAFRFTENPGAAFSLFENAGPFLGVAAVVAVGAIGAGLARPRPLHEVIAFGMIIAGALGNLIDRIARGQGFLDGHVIDWVQLPNFPTFNLADSSITVAVAILLIGSWRQSAARGGAVDRPRTDAAG
ncbi:MAG: signal peptidase II [Acidimicrobiia bacterium]